MGGRYGPDQRDPPFAAGHDGIGVVLKVAFRDQNFIWAVMCGRALAFVLAKRAPKAGRPAGVDARMCGLRLRVSMNICSRTPDEQAPKRAST